MPQERDQVDALIRGSAVLFNNTQHTLALGLIALSKHDRAEMRYGEGYDDAQLAEMDAFTESEIEQFRAQAGIMLAQFAAYISVPEPGTPTGWHWWAGVWQGIVASWAYALSLIAIAGLFRVFGSDIITAIEWWAGKHP